MDDYQPLTDDYVEALEPLLYDYRTDMRDMTPCIWCEGTGRGYDIREHREELCDACKGRGEW